MHKKTIYTLASLLGCAILSMGMPMTLLAGKSSVEHPVKPPTDANIVGHVLDAKTGEHVVGVTISIKGTTYGTSTDATGHFYLKNLKPGPITLMMSGVGYKSQEKQVKVEKGKTLEINFRAEEDQISLDEVVVSSSRQATLRRLAPTLVQVVDDREFSRVNANNLAQGIVFQPGLRVENNCQNCGFNQVRINGLDGHYTQILLDSRPIVSSLAGVYGIEQIPTSMVDRVEVVRCGGSALYGSSAIGGVVNIITKDPVSNAFSFGESLSMTGLSKVDNNLFFNGSIVSDNNRMGGVFFGQSRYRAPWDANGDGFSEIGKIKALSLGGRFFFKVSDYSRISAEVHNLSEYRRGGDHFDLPDHAAMVSEHVDHNIYGLSTKYDLFSNDYKHHFQAFVSGQMVRRNSYYGGLDGEYKDQNGNPIDSPIVGVGVDPATYGVNYGVTRGETYMGGVQYTYDFDKLFFMPAQILLGSEVTYDALNDRMPLRQFTAMVDGSGNPIKDAEGRIQTLFPTINQRIMNYSQLGQIEWKNDAWSILLGGRLDENSAVKKPIFSPRTTLRFNPTKNINFRASYAKGFRAPQVFDEDLHVGVVGGEAQRIENAEDLRPETSHSVSLSTDIYGSLGEMQYNITLDGFYTRLLDVFSTQEQASKGDGIMRFTRINKDAATIQGVNLEAKLAYRWLQFQTGWTLSRSRYDQPQEWGLAAQLVNDKPVKTDGEYNVAQYSDRYLRTPDFYGYFTLSLTPINRLNLSFTGNYTGRMYVPHVITYGQKSAVVDMHHAPIAGEEGIRIDELKETPSFFEMGSRLAYTFRVLESSDLELFMGMNNILNSFQKDFDLGASRDSGYIYGPSTPRTSYVGFRLSF